MELISKFFTANVLDENSTYTTTSGSVLSASYLYDRSIANIYTSVGSDDLTDEVIEIQFDGNETFNRILMNTHNIKSGVIEYWNGSAWVDFSTAISLSGNSDTTSYFEFDSVTCSKIRLTLYTTMSVDDEKTIAELLVFTELGTLSSSPVKTKIGFPKYGVQRKSANGGSINVIFGKKYQGSFTYTNVGISDIEILETLDNLGTSFYFWPCGGNIYTNMGFRLKDIYLVNYTNDFEPNDDANLLNGNHKITCDFDEV